MRQIEPNTLLGCNIVYGFKAYDIMKSGVMMQYFEWNLPNDGKLWTLLKEEAAFLKEIGVTAVWIPPAYKADEQVDEGYATCDLYDYGVI